MSEKYYIYRHAWRFDDAHHNEKELSKNQINELLSKGGWLVRNTFDFDQKDKSDFWFLIKDNFNNFEEYSSNVRNQIRKALKVYRYEIIDTALLKENGYCIYKKSINDYKIKDRKITKEKFDNFFNDKCECWGCYEKSTNELVGFSINYIWDNSCQYEVISILPRCKSNSTYPYYGLFHEMNRYYLEEKKFKYVSDGSRSITEHSNIQEFLVHNFKFRKAYCKLKVHYKWWFGVVVKALFPFRNIIPIRSVKAILRMEEYSRSFK